MDTKERNSSIELLRILAIIGVIILHYNNSEMGSGFKYVTEGSINQLYLFFSESVFICAVDLFVMISAFYLSNTKKRRFIKIVELNIQVIAFRLAMYVASWVIKGEELSIKSMVVCFLPVNYFVILYSILYILSPYMNVLIEKISRHDLKKLITKLVLIFSVWTVLVDYLENLTGQAFNGLSTVGMYGSQYGYSIVNFILIYFIGAYIRKNGIKIKKNTAIVSVMVLICIIYSLSLIEHKLGLESVTTWNYNNPLIILLSAVILLLFMNWNYNNKVINELARGTFTCFLFHECLIDKVHVENFVNRPLIELIIHQICVAVGLYLLSYVVYKLYTICSKWFIKIITPLFNKVDISLD